MLSIPHGGKLINQILSKKKKEEILKIKDELPSLKIRDDLLDDIRNIAKGVYSPLQGFLKEKDFKRVLEEARLSNGIIWPIPIVLDISKKEAEKLKDKKLILLLDSQNHPIAILENPEIFEYHKKNFAKKVFGTLDKNHPGVKEIFQMKEYLIGGEIKLLDDSKGPFPEYNFSPKETRKIFKKKEWKKIAGFQTRNVPHLGHEFLQRHTLNLVDGLFIQPVIGKKKIKDFKDELILASYEILIDKYHPKDRIVLGILPIKMRYAGPREAVFHALIRKNFGCTHFIVGRDHAGFKNYYPPFASQKIFDQFYEKELGIRILKYQEVVYCKECKRYLFIDSCSHKEKTRFSATKIRRAIERKKEPPGFIRPEIYYLLSNCPKALIDREYQKESSKKPGFCLWFTGLSQAGKTTLGDRIYKILKEKGIKVERLDGDIIRQSLSKDLGFSKEDREENIRRVGTLAKLFSQKGIAVVASFISPYRKQRKELRKKIPNFIEIFCNCPLELCEKRDKKGLYQKARKGIIKNFTGISAPYQKPKNPEIELRTDKLTIEECVQKIINYLKTNQFI